MERGDVRELAVLVRDIVDANRYMTLATADGDGRPWATPVWYAHDGYRDFFWVSRSDARHSRSIASRAEVGIVIFDSTVPVGGAQAVYVEAVAEQVPATELESAIATYSLRSQAHGASPWRVEDVVGSASHRLYRARAVHHFVLGANDRRIPVDLDPR
jgi:uncharacterized protein YhbP (UPF0306 family)